jgi:L-ribulose-5-phosphate 3-epimerase
MSILRRKFLTSASAGIASACFGRTATAGQFTGKIRKAVKYHMVAGDGSVEDKFRMVKDLGFDGIEPRVAAGPENRELVNAFAAAREKTGLPIHGMVNGNRPNLIEAIDQAKFLGANSVLHVVGYDRKIGYLENYRRTQELIRSAIDHAEKQNVKILLENVWATFLIEPLGMARFVDELDSPQVKVYFDVGNVVRWGYPQHWIEVLGDRIEKLDIKEYDLNIAMNDGMRKGFDRPLGGGSVDWESVRQELVKINYEGWATAEVRGGDRQRLADIATQMDDVLSL